jgi:crotonobetaine/carnitine-CoA ligase
MLTYPHFEPRFPRNQWTLPHVLETQARERPNAPFLQWTDAGKAMTYDQVNREVNQLAHGFASLGVGAGDKVAIFLPNCIEYPLIWFALNKLGAAEVTIADSFKADFLSHPLKLSRARMVVTTYGLAPRLYDEEIALTDLDRVILVADDTENVSREPPPFRRLISSAYSDLPAARDDNPVASVGPRDIAAVLFTSGTTGPSKAVMMPHAQFYFFSEEIINVTKLTADDVYLSSFPFFHANAQVETIYPSMIMGMRCVLYRKFSASDWLGRIRRSGATVTNLLGATMSFVASQPEREDDRHNPLRCLFTAPTPENLCAYLIKRFAVDALTTGFGQTEISMPFLSPWKVKLPDGAVGVLLDQWFEIAIADPRTGEALSGPATGELLVRHRVPGIISDGFLGMPEKTLETRADLWFHTGDVLRRDADGWFYFVDRLKDTLRRRGENISSFEVENVVRDFPAVAECAVVGVPADEQGGEDEVMAFIVLAEGQTVNPGELIAFCEARMPSFALPRYLQIIDVLPQSASGKVLKTELRKKGVGPNTWDRVAN